jgi:5S rRNA maturation endonuclease (ribonuclease M5)
MNIDISCFIKDYLTTKFSGKFKLSSNGRELMMNSPVDPTDRKQHFSINLETGLWQDFRKGEKGNFYFLYSYLEGITYKQAIHQIQIRSLYKQPVQVSTIEAPSSSIQEEIKNFVPIKEDKQPELELEIAAYLYLSDRKILNNKYPFFVATAGRFHGRVIIPFWRNDDLVYFQARSLIGQKPKYLNPGSEFGLKSKNYLFPFDLSEKYVVICEGPTDAISLQLQGVNATATLGCSISPTQSRMLAGFQGRIIVGYDNDEAGISGLNRLHQTINCQRVLDVSYCFPDKQYKDWNDMHVDNINLRQYVKENTHEYDPRVFKIQNEIYNINSLSSLNNH